MQPDDAPCKVTQPRDDSQNAERQAQADRVIARAVRLRDRRKVATDDTPRPRQGER